MKTAILPCPFCGGPATYRRVPSSLVRPELEHGFWTLGCDNKSQCDCEVYAFGDTKTEALRNWNHRASAATAVNGHSKKKIAAAIQMQIDTLRNSFTDRIGPRTGQITNRKIADEIECLKAAKQLVEGVRR